MLCNRKNEKQIPRADKSLGPRNDAIRVLKLLNGLLIRDTRPKSQNLKSTLC